MKLEGKVDKTVVRPAMLYGAESQQRHGQQRGDNQHD